jgi:hypothetical protein
MPRYTIDSPEVASLLSGTHRCSPQSYFRIDEDGKCRTYPIRRLLMSLGINQKLATQLMQQANIPYAEFVRNKVENPAATVREDPEKDRRLEEIKEEARQLKEARQADKLSSKRFQLIETTSGKHGTKHGIWDAENGTVVSLYWTKEEALAELVRLRSGGFHSVIHGSGYCKPRPDVTY